MVGNRIMINFLEFYSCFSSTEKNWRKHADDLVYMCETELDSIRNCVDCYMNSSKFIKNGFTKICRQPHLLVWMEYKKYAYWPAKVMSIRDQKINLHFFGDYSTISTIADKCFLCSEQTPSIRPPKSLQYKRAIEVSEIRSFFKFNFIKFHNYYRN